MLVRTASLLDFEAIRNVELAAFETLRAAGAVSGPAEASSDEELKLYFDNGLLFVATDVSGAVIGYCGGYVADDCVHVGEMDVHPDWQRRGLGRRLLSTVIDEAKLRNLERLTLTTDRFAPFNAPFYETMGLAIVERSQLSPRLHAILEAEIRKGLGPERRVAMTMHL
ncbi:GNAT superfamily N-acetyltransferase [Peteryoungia aggregata LMG 23059]|uniref:GNAT superfamily N-acetyltransferase n=1 Tax=Peteryoungia aggregata LMG 23059 TaxID=1368425 RepID=A0ABU0GDF9_9HYPH|nr:GNAT family N-acetyltransferase [Peteryoungia aggregata]MDQ0423392.1 GNAT superfamily N-acetyltransferase [Peteryoungia aggregata LMG 23059]